MRKILILTIVLYGAFVSGCNPNKFKSDKEFKDSIAKADKNTVLGNIKFGISRDEFYKQAEIFYKKQKGCIYNTRIKSIEGNFTEKTEKLYHVLFVCGYWFDSPSDSLPESPYREFVIKKFGEPNDGNDGWVVGDREIYTGFQYRLRPLGAFYTDEDEMGHQEKTPGGMDWSYHHYYELSITSQSLGKLNLEEEEAELNPDSLKKEKNRREDQIIKL